MFHFVTRLRVHFYVPFFIVVGIIAFMFVGCSASISEESMELLTYNYSDPDIVPETGRIYPYARFEGYTDKGEMKEWKMVVLENRYIKLWITPEIGGKIWGAIDKKTGKEFIYFNDVVKFRDVAMRGAWTSGGLEINFGVIGHSPTCSTPVDYSTVENRDGSVSCFLGAVDLPSESRWTVEVRLHPDDAFFTTHSTWQNRDQLTQPYYHWMNVGVKSSGNLEYVYPGDHHLGHDGSIHSWPKDDVGREISWYNKNDFSGYKSFHVFGELTEFFGGYWHDDEYGFGHYADYDDKPGKKIWIWGLSRHGMIWEDLLTDTKGQYTEIQSGRLFNQAIAGSTNTPFKHRSFAPGQTDSFTEYWFPVGNLGGLKYGTADASINVEKNANLCTVSISPNRKKGGLLKVLQGEQLLFSSKVKGVPLEAQHFSFETKAEIAQLSFYWNNTLLYEGNRAKVEMNRPVTVPDDFSWENSEGYSLKGKEWERQRFFTKANTNYNQALELNPCSVESLVGAASIAARQMQFEKAYLLAQKALAVDTYHPAANMIYALSASKMGNEIDAIDGYSIASASQEYRIASYNELAEIYYKRGEIDRAQTYIDKATLVGSRIDKTILLQALIFRNLNKEKKASRLLKANLTADPLNHGVAASLALISKTGSARKRWTDSITHEFPVQTKIENALFYLNLGQIEDALWLLAEEDNDPVVALYQAFLYSEKGDQESSLNWLSKAADLSPAGVFPFRYETLELLEWAQNLNDSWKFKYYAGLIYQNTNQESKALALYEKCGSQPDFYPFYINQYKQGGVALPLTPEKADFILSLADEWMNYFELIPLLEQSGALEKAVELASQAVKKFPDNYYLGLKQARVLNQIGEYQLCSELFNKIKVLPNEGATAGRTLWRETHLMLAFDSWEQNNYKEALHFISEARKWPENLGVGRPYDVDERVEDYFAMLCAEKLEDINSKDFFAQAVKAFALNLPPDILPNSAELLSALLLKKSGTNEQASAVMNRFKSKNAEAINYRWAESWYQGDHFTASKIAREKEAVTTSLPYAIPDIDVDFQFVMKLVHM